MKGRTVTSYNMEICVWAPHPGALHFHDLRAEAACRLYEHSGRDVLRVMRCLDHRSLAETQVYLERLMGATETETVPRSPFALRFVPEP